MRRKTLGALVCFALVLLLVGIFSVLALTTDHIVPDNPITTPEEALAAPQMLVAPTDEQGNTDGESDSDEPDEEEQDPNEQETIPPTSKLSELIESRANASSTAGSQQSPTGTPGDESSHTIASGKEGGQGSAYRIKTNLRNRTVTKADLNTSEELEFYAYLEHARDGMELQVRLYNSSIGGNGMVLEASGGRYYRAPLTLGTNNITLYVYEDGKLAAQTNCQIIYQAEKANRDNPVVGPHPPTIWTNFDDGSNANVTRTPFTLEVEATDYHGNDVTSSRIGVYLDNSTTPETVDGGSKRYLYDLDLVAANVGDTRTYVVGILAWDAEGNSRYVEHAFTYHFTEIGDKIGTISVSIDLTSLGKSVISLGSLDVHRGENLKDIFSRALEPLGYIPQFKGDYLESIYASGIGAGYAIPATLQERLDKDGLVDYGLLNGGDTLAEFDITAGSGWNYFVNGVLAGRNIGAHLPADGQSIMLYFTLAWGKDAGGTGQGVLSSYCGSWIGGVYTENHSLDTYQVIKEPTCTEEGEGAYVCSVCGAISSKPGAIADGLTLPIPALGHDWTTEGCPHMDPTETEDGYQDYICRRCGEVKREIIPATGGSNPSQP